jgi:hypothetical protein
LASDGLASDQFGVCATVYSTSAMIGAYKDDNAATDAGMNNLIYILL